MAALGPGTPAPLPPQGATLAVCVACGGRGWSGVAKSTGSRAVGLAGNGPRGGPGEAREILAGT